ncbi:MAG: HU family DNA-binding protein, partial [Candidatus Izemoplasmataceae bacterium]
EEDVSSSPEIVEETEQVKEAEPVKEEVKKEIIEETPPKDETPKEKRKRQEIFAVDDDEPSSKATKTKKAEKDVQEKKPFVKGAILEATKKRRTQSHTKEDISLVIEELTDLDYNQARDFIDTLISVMSEALVAHDKIAIHQFGTFTCSKLKARSMQVPTTSEETTEIPEHYVVRFKGSPAFNDYLNNGSPLPIEPPSPSAHPVDTQKKDTKSKPNPKKKPQAKSIVKDDIIENILSTCELTPKDAEKFYVTLLDVMQESLMSEDKIAIHQFGTFDITKHKEKTMVVPNTDETVIVPEHNVIKFKPSKAFTDALNPSKK